jgi:hypothetical protein
MTRRPQSALTRLARTLRRQPPRPGLQGAVQRVAIALLPPPVSAPPARTGPISPDGENETSRLRARRALLEARQALSGMLGETPGGPPDGAEALGEAPTPDLERLRAHLEESQRDRLAVREEIGRLRSEMEDLARRLARLEVTAAAPAADEPGPPSGIEPADASGGTPVAAMAPSDEGPPPTPGATDGAGAEAEPAAHGEGERAGDATTVRELRERVLRALRDRVFAAGTVGTRIELAPAPDAGELQAITERLQGEPLVDSAEPIETTEVAASIRVTLRAPLRWEQFGGLLERALQRPLRPGEVHWSHGAVRVRSGGDRAATPPMPGAAVGAAPDDAV